MKFRKPLWLTAVVMPAAILLSSCNMGAAAPAAPTMVPGAIETQAFGIVLTQSAAQQTQTAMAIPPTAMPTSTLFSSAPPPSEIPVVVGDFTPIATLPGIPLPASPAPTLGAVSTLTTTNGCNDGFYEGETRPYDGAQMKPSEAFEKAWTIKNTGTCAWDEGYMFVVNNAWSIGIEELKGESTSITIKKSEDVIKPGKSQSFRLKLQAPKKLGQYKWCWKLKDDSGAFFGPLVCTIFNVINN